MEKYLVEMPAKLSVYLRQYRVLHDRKCCENRTDHQFHYWTFRKNVLHKKWMNNGGGGKIHFRQVRFTIYILRHTFQFKNLFYFMLNAKRWANKVKDTEVNAKHFSAIASIEGAMKHQRIHTQMYSLEETHFLNKSSEIGVYLWVTYVCVKFSSIVNATKIVKPTVIVRHWKKVL